MKTVTSGVILVVLVLGLQVVCCGQERTINDYGAFLKTQTNGVLLTMTFTNTKPVYIIGTPIIVEMRMKNEGDEDVEISFRDDVIPVLADAEGRIVPGRKKIAVYRVYEKGKINVPVDYRMGGASAIRVAPGKEWTMAINLDHYDIRPTKEGLYRLVVVRDGWISNMIEIKVAEK